MFKANNKDTTTASITSIWVSSLLTLADFIPCSAASIVNFEQVNPGWGTNLLLPKQCLLDL